MKKPEEQLKVANPKAVTVADALGISEERAQYVRKKVTTITKAEQDSEEGHAGTICKVWNEFENPAECAFAMYILQHAEAYAEIHSLFSLPEAVESKA